jgi:hypothetical protein
VSSLPLQQPSLLHVDDLRIKELVAKIIAHKMRNMKQRSTKAAEARAESQPEDSSDLPRQDRKGLLPSNIIDLEDFDVDAARDVLPAEPQEKDREKNSAIREEVIETQQYMHSRRSLYILS